MSAEIGSMQRGVPDNPVVENVLARRYASLPMKQLFSEENAVISQQEYWTVIMQGQHDLGIEIPQENIDDYREVSDIAALDQIREREIVLRHDEKAMIETFNHNAGGHEDAHKALTSRDVSDNVEQARIKNGLVIVKSKLIAALARHGRRASEYSAMVYAGRTHNAPAQSNLIGKLFSDSGEELLRSYERIVEFEEGYPMRGLKGAMGTQTDLLQLFDGDQDKVDALEKKVAEHYGFKKIMNSVGQVYPRSLDLEMVNHLYGLTTGPTSLSLTLRGMAGRDQFTEGFKDGQVGSSAMPHKMNTRTLERLRGLKAVLAGHTAMAQDIAGEQWYGGDVSDSVARRVFIPDSFFAVDAFYESYLTVLDECGFYPAVIQAELEKYLPFLTTTRLLVESMKNGIGREKAHSAIKDHATQAALDMRQKGDMGKSLIQRLAHDPRMEGVTIETLGSALEKPIEFVGSAPEQINRFIGKVDELVTKNPKDASYIPQPIL